MLSCRRGPRVRDSPLPVQSPFPRFGTLLPPERLQETRYAATKRRTQCLAAVPKRCPAPVARTLTGSLRSHLPRRPRVDPESSAIRERSRPLTPSRARRPAILLANAPLVGFAPSRPQHPAHHVIASRRCLSCPSYSPRATPLFRLPAASSRFPLTHPAPARLPYERPLTFFARAVLHEHQEKACQQRISEHSLCMRLRRTRSKKKGSVSAPPPRMTRVSVQPQRVNPASPSVRSVPTPLHPTASRQRPP